jgi:glutamyl-tRNA reductase
MRIKSGESKEDWAKRVQQYEYGHALQRIAQGDPVELVLDDMSKRMTQKLLHPFIQDIKDSNKTEFNAEESRRRYKEVYLDKTSPAADQVSDLPTDY